MPLLHILQVNIKNCKHEHKHTAFNTQRKTFFNGKIIGKKTYPTKCCFLFWDQWHIHISGETIPPVIRVPQLQKMIQEFSLLREIAYLMVKAKARCFTWTTFYCDSTCLRHPHKGRNEEMDLFGWRSLTEHGWWVLQFRENDLKPLV